MGWTENKSVFVLTSKKFRIRIGVFNEGESEMNKNERADGYLQKKKIRGALIGGYNRVSVYETIREVMRLNEEESRALKEENARLIVSLEEIKADYADQIEALKGALRELDGMRGDRILTQITDLLKSSGKAEG